MSVPIRTFGLLGLAVAMMGAGYLFVPAPGATPLPPSAPKPVPVAAAVAPVVPAPSAPTSATPAAAAPVAKPAPTLAANRAPVPLVTRGHANYYASTSIDAAGGTGKPSATDGKPSVDMGTFTSSSLSPEAQAGSDPQQALLTEPGDDSKARAAVELDGYKNVRGMVKDADGVWRGRAMRGRTEIAIRVNADGSVSAD
jgi:hypothetical protein